MTTCASVDIRQPGSGPQGRFRRFWPSARTRKTRELERLVIVGNGPAGFRLCEQLVLRGGGSHFHIVVLGEEPRPAYDRVRMTRFLEGASEDTLQLAAPSWYRDHGIELRTGEPVVAIDREGKCVRTVRDNTFPYDKLVLATGSRAFVPAMPGTDLPGVFVYRTLDDLDRLRAHANAGCRRVAVIGGGLLGLEAAAALRGLHLNTWVIERGLTLLARQLDPKGGRMLQRHIERLGIHTLTQRETERIIPAGDDLLVEFTTGECLRVRAAVIAAGIRPRDDLAVAAGLRTGHRGGVDVDDGLRTSDPSIHAIGDCASHRQTVYGLAGPAFLMAEVLTERLLGRDRSFTGADVSSWLKVPGLSVAALGDYQSNSETLTAETNGAYRRVLIQEGRLVGATAVGDWPEQARVHSAILDRRRVWRWQRSRFQRTGRLWKEAERPPVTEWPEKALVCNCRGVARGTLSAACAEGCKTVAQLAQRTGASTVCGSCAPLLAELLGTPLASPVAARTLRGLLIASLIGLSMAALILLAPPLSLSDSVRSARFDFLWRDSSVRQITGFTLLGVVFLSLLFSARKRIPRFSRGKVTTWRTVHTVLGTLALLLLVTHTGFRLGANFNRVLMLNFLALAVMGSLAGAVTALERRFAGPLGRRLRAGWTGLHIALTWPFPVLVLFHVFIAYYF